MELITWKTDWINEFEFFRFQFFSNFCRKMIHRYSLQNQIETTKNPLPSAGFSIATETWSSGSSTASKSYVELLRGTTNGPTTISPQWNSSQFDFGSGVTRLRPNLWPSTTLFWVPRVAITYRQHCFPMCCGTESRRSIKALPSAAELGKPTFHWPKRIPPEAVILIRNRSKVRTLSPPPIIHFHFFRNDFNA